MAAETQPSASASDSKRPENPLDLSVREIIRRTIGTAIDIIEDISRILSGRRQMSNTELRRSVFKTFGNPSRRMYVGIWLVFLSFMLYFIDSAA